jgi:hypothetical protein
MSVSLSDSLSQSEFEAYMVNHHIDTDLTCATSLCCQTWQDAFFTLIVAHHSTLDRGFHVFPFYAFLVVQLVVHVIPLCNLTPAATYVFSKLHAVPL